MKTLFVGDTQGNTGPVNVNKKLVQHFTADFLCVKQGGKLAQLWDGVRKMIRCDVVVASGVARKACVFFGLAKILRKKTVFIMHGCAAYEYRMNGQTNVKRNLMQEEFLLETADLLLPVSKKFMLWVHNRYPHYADKTKYLFNGIDADTAVSRRITQKKRGSIIATGGDRKVKNNSVVAQAVERIGGSVKFDIYGLIYHSAPEGNAHTAYRGLIPHDLYMEKMEEAELFVLNSIFETFSISTIEALQCGCSVLVSEAAGVTDLLALEENDIIHDPMDADEIEAKIRYLLEHPNNECLMSKLDLKEYSYQKSVERLKDLCFSLVGEKSVR